MIICTSTLFGFYYIDYSSPYKPSLQGHNVLQLPFLFSSPSFSLSIAITSPHSIERDVLINREYLSRLRLGHRCQSLKKLICSLNFDSLEVLYQIYISSTALFSYFMVITDP